MKNAEPYEISVGDVLLQGSMTQPDEVKCEKCDLWKVLVSMNPKAWECSRCKELSSPMTVNIPICFRRRSFRMVGLK